MHSVDRNQYNLTGLSSNRDRAPSTLATKSNSTKKMNIYQSVTWREKSINDLSKWRTRKTLFERLLRQLLLMLHQENVDKDVDRSCWVRSPIGQLSLPLLGIWWIEYRPVWLGLGPGVFTCVGWQDPTWQVTLRRCHGVRSINSYTVPLPFDAGVDAP